MSESQRIAYVGLCAVMIQKMIQEVSIEEMVKVKVKVRQLDGTVETEARVTPKKARGRHRVNGRMHEVRLRDWVPPLVEMKEVMNPLNDLVLIADFMYNSRSRSLLFRVGSHLSLSWWDTVVFEGRIGEAWERQSPLRLREAHMTWEPSREYEERKLEESKGLLLTFNVEH
ncbi:hypothetical protein C8J55DRAFT_494200 [Lentinula edodes]|uniref:Uncharacterized protein n=1 Tax=Lentinula lateritia TaxID=40482 RepID=A0A9W8ZQQ0_9AGAR|nr:hypothetical protein C8J55DRAFT_494200 [Lentinula edodes]